MHARTPVSVVALSMRRFDVQQQAGIGLLALTSLLLSLCHAR